MNDVKSFVTAFNSAALKEKVNQNGGKLSFKLNGTDVELIHGEDFFYTASELAAAQH